MYVYPHVDDIQCSLVFHKFLISPSWHVLNLRYEPIAILEIITSLFECPRSKYTVFSDTNGGFEILLLAADEFSLNLF